MSFQPGAMLNTQAWGNRAENVEVPVIQSRAPATTDYLFPVGKRWIDSVNNAEYGLTSLTSTSNIVSAAWQLLGSASGSVASVLGTANQVTVTTVSNVATVSLPSAIITPGSLTTTTTLTATLGAITATNGNLVLGAAGNKMIRSSVATTTTAGANSMGTVTLVGGTATISTTAVTASSLIQISRMSVGATGANPLGLLSVGTISAGASFVINAWSATDATALAATDVSSIVWEITN